MFALTNHLSPHSCFSPSSEVCQGVECAVVMKVVREEYVDDGSRFDFIDPCYALGYGVCPSYIWPSLNAEYLAFWISVCEP